MLSLTCPSECPHLGVGLACLGVVALTHHLGAARVEAAEW
jgi:hypothetical protein